MNPSFSPQTFLSLIVIILALFLPCNALAVPEQKVVEIDTIIELLPLHLTPQWWNQFGQANRENLALHTKRLTQELNSINTPEEARELASQVTTLLGQYETRRNTPLPIKGSVKNKEKRVYFLDDIFQLIKQKKSITSDLMLLKTNHNLLFEEIRSAGRQLNKVKLSYLKNLETDTNKLIEGLNWIRARLHLSLLGLSEKAMLSQLALFEETLQELREENQFSLDLLVITPKEIKEAKLLVALLEDKIDDTKKEVQQLKSKERSIVVNNKETKFAKQLLSLNALETAVKLKKVETEYLTQLLVKNIERLKKDSHENIRSAIRKDLRKGINHIKETTSWMKEAGSRVEREENAINSQKVLDTDKTHQQLIQRRLTALAKVYKQGVELDEKQDKLNLLIIITDDKLGKTAKGAAIFVEKADETLRVSWKKIVKWINTSLFSLGGTPVTPIGLLHFLVILFIGWFISRVFLRVIRKVNNRTRGGMQESSIMTLGRIFSFVIIGISLLVGFSSLGIDVTKLALVASALSIGIGFGLQNIINNFVSGIILLFERSMKVGDYIMLADGTRGEVREINIRSTVINTNDNIDVIVPNSEFVNNSVTNWTMNERFLRLKIPFGVAYGSDKELVRRIIVDAALSLPYTLNSIDRQYPQVRLKNFGESSLDFELVVWIKAEWANRPGRVKAAYNWEIETALLKNKVDIPFPQREFRLLAETPIVT
jgi:small-conductance mechanosensitive channel